MKIIMHEEAGQREIENVIHEVVSLGLNASQRTETQNCVIEVSGNKVINYRSFFARLPAVYQIIPQNNNQNTTFISRDTIPDDTTFNLNGVEIGGPGIYLIAGPCAVEEKNQLIETALAIKEAGGHALRGGSFKPRTSPYAFQGFGVKALEWLAEAREISGLPVFTEAMAEEQIPLIAEHADVIQIGARNMQNFNLLHAAGQAHHPVLLKRGMSASINEFLMAAEYILSHGNERVILCERGIRTFETSTRNTTDINAIPVLKEKTHLPVFLDPSHSTGHTQYVAAVSRAAIAAGADGLIIEVHHQPEKALSDGQQSLTPEQFAKLVKQIKAIAESIDRELPSNEPISIDMDQKELAWL